MSPRHPPAPAKVDLLEAFSRFDDLWSPKLVAELHGQHVRLAKVEGEFVWHHHDDEDELFLVVKGRLAIELRDRTVELGEGELLVVPRGVEHRPVATEEAWILLFEPATTVNTGSAGGDRTVEVGRLSRARGGPRA